MSRRQRKLPLVFITRDLGFTPTGNRTWVEEGTDHRERVWVVCKRGLTSMKTNLQKRGLKPGDTSNAN